MMPPVLAIVALVTLLFGGFYAGPLVVLAHLTIAAFWYRRQKENKEDRKERPATGPVYALLAGWILALYVGGYVLDRLLASVTDGPAPGVGYFFWAIADAFDVGSWVDGALYDRAALLIHSLLLLPLLYVGSIVARKSVLRQDPNRVTWVKRLVTMLATALRLDAFVKGGSELTAAEEEAQRQGRTQSIEVASRERETLVGDSAERQAVLQCGGIRSGRPA